VSRCKYRPPAEPSGRADKADKADKADNKADKGKKSNEIAFPATPGFREFWNRCTQAGENPNYNEIAREIVDKHDDSNITVESLTRAGRRYRSSLRDAES
jgi:hypothetical protein